MAQKGTTKVGLVVILVVMLWDVTMAQSGCTTALIGLAPCLSYVSGNSSTPSTSCRTQLSNVVQSQPRCLCSLLNGGGSSFGLTINQTAALELPGACNVQTPPVSRCNGVANGPTSSSVDSRASTPTSNSPTDSPSDSFSGEVPEAETASTTRGAGSKSVPSTNNNNNSNNNNASNGAMIRTTHALLAFVFVMLFFKLLP